LALTEQNSEVALRRIRRRAARYPSWHAMPHYAAICRSISHEDRRANGTWPVIHVSNLHLTW